MPTNYNPDTDALETMQERFEREAEVDERIMRGELGKAANFDSPFDGSNDHLLPRNAADCAAKLRQYNRWRRGEDWEPDEDGPNPIELGLLIDYAADALDAKAPDAFPQAHRLAMDIENLLNYLERKTADTHELQAASVIIALRQRVAELEKERDELQGANKLLCEDIVERHDRIAELAAERDALMKNGERRVEETERRVSACVNACVGIPDEQLYDQEPGCLLSAMVEQEQEIMAITKQRDELLAALRGLVASCDTGERGPDGRQHGTRMPDRCFVQAGHDAIARVKGGAA